jgi:large-conductance mechanosensitive channel
MARIPKVTVTFDADLNQLKSGVKNATTDVDSFSDRVSDFGRKAALAFAAAGAAIGAFALASVKAAAEDEAGQKKLEETIRNTTNATAEQIAGIDKYVTAQSIATATTDDVIRPALSRLLRSTGDLTKAQELLTLSQEIAAATGKPLEAVTNAVAKSFDGSNTALTKLGVGIDAATLKTLTFDETQQLLNKTFDGFIENQSTTAEFKFRQLTIAIDETKEQVGAALLPVVTQFTQYLIDNVVPAVQSFVDGLTGAQGLKDSLTSSEQTAVQWGQRVRKVIDIVVEFKDQLIVLSAVIAGVFVVSKIAAGVTATIALVRSLIVAYNALKASALVAGIASAFALNPLLGVGAVALAAGVLSAANALTNQDEGQSFAASKGAIPFASGFAPATVSIPSFGGVTGLSGGSSTSGVQTAAKAAAAAATTTTTLTNPFGAGAFKVEETKPTTTINLNVSGAIDPEATARQIVDTLNDSYYRGTGGAGALVAI